MIETDNQFIIFTYDQDLTDPRSSLFHELLENGLADEKNDKILIPHEEICRLSSIELNTLDLPDTYPFEIKIDPDGLLQSPDFKFKLRFFEYNNGNQLFGKHEGCVLTLNDGTQYLLSSDQYVLCNAVDEFNSQPVKELSASLIGLSDIKELSKKAGAILDPFLENENIIVPEKISLKLKKGTDESLEILPEIENLKDEELVRQFEEKKFDRFNRIPATYTLTDEDNNRIRIPLTGKQQDEFKKIKKYRKTSGELKQRIIKNPQEFFDPDIIDLDNFSDRVTKIGLYKPKHFPFISPYESEWIPGIIIDYGDQKTKIIVRDQDELEELESAYNDSIADNTETVAWKDFEISIEECNALINISRKQHTRPGEPVRETEQRKVLIIEDNIYEDKFHSYKKVPISETFIHRLEHPPSLKKEISLYEHQKEGIAWMESLFQQNYSGGLLADDMGLGKTIQILSFIDWHYCKKNEGQKPYLITAPFSLIENWQAEYARFFQNDLKMRYFHGSDSISFEQLNRPQIVVTTYETVRSSKNQFIFGQVDWAVVVLDEAQKIKTPGTIITNVIKALKADFKIAATGTPVENSMIDLWCIADFVVPGLLGSAKEFSKKYQSTIRKDISDEELNLMGVQLRSEVGLYFKRRLKRDILTNLPQKTDQRKKIPMPEFQKNLYVREIQESQASDKNQVLSAIHNLKTISDHPYLMGYDFQNISSEILVETSARLRATIEILEQVRQNSEKAIIFAEFRNTQKILQKVIQDKFGLKVSIINGETAVGGKAEDSQKLTRQKAIDSFSEKPGFNVIIMSPIAAGVGLNVTSANHVIHYSRHWNPAKEAQATDRAYRIGQTKEVYVYYPIAVLPDINTFDVILDNLLLQKRNLADSAMFPSAISEVRVDDFSRELSFGPKDKPEEYPLKTEELDRFEPHFFEAAVAAVFKKKGFRVILTPNSNDKGADVVAMSDAENFLIQVKQSKNPINDKAVGEILKAKGYYESKYKKKFSLMVATNNELNSNARVMAENNKVSSFIRSDFEEFLSKNDLYYSEIRQIENERYAQI
ncbi:MAG: DEAD/DEAH box helicase family protein [Desulfobacterales bacterium]|nr:DEAD/DEAH box helicase family protein [Desulfobacterales bacterium]